MSLRPLLDPVSWKIQSYGVFPLRVKYFLQSTLPMPLGQSRYEMVQDPDSQDWGLSAKLRRTFGMSHFFRTSG